MATSIKPIKLYGSVFGPNPEKVAFILNELSIPFEGVIIMDVKDPAYTAINPNGRLPAIYDPNTEITLWESGAIVDYLIATYDKENIISFPANSVEDFHCKQWFYFQVSGQGPYYGQGRWFTSFFPEKLPGAIERYNLEIKRVTGVLEKALEGKEWLVGGKITYVDLAFFTWQKIAEDMIVPDWDAKKEFPNVAAWMKKLSERPSVKNVIKEQARISKLIKEERAKAEGLAKVEQK